MGLDQTVTGHRLVAGIGFRHGVPSDAIVALLRRALAEAPEGGLVAIATAADRACEPAIRDAAAAFGLLPVAVESDALLQADPRVPTRSARIVASRGVGSLAEAVALAVAGDDGRLVVARIDDGRATCALAMIGREGLPIFAGDAAAFPPPAEGGGKGLDASQGQEPTSEHAAKAQIVIPIA